MDFRFDPKIDYYARLGLSYQAELEVIKSAYRALSKKYHPDNCNGDNSRMQEINDAYAVLSKEELKKSYDAARYQYTKSQQKDEPITEEPPKKQSETRDETAKAWVRFFARLFDMWWEGIFLAGVFIVAAWACPIDFEIWIWKDPVIIFMGGIILFFFSWYLDAIVYNFFGNTPGKSLLGLKVYGAGKLSLTISQYFYRNLSVWMQGIGFGIPIINLLTMGWQERRLKKGKQTSYDESKGYYVLASPVSWAQKTVFAVGFLFLFFCVSLIDNTYKIYLEDIEKSPSSQNKNQNIELDSGNYTDKIYNQSKKSDYNFYENDKKIEINTENYNFPENRSERISSLFDKGEYYEVIKEAESGNFLVKSYNLIGISFLKTGKLESAINAFLEAEKFFPESDVIKGNLGDAYFQYGRIDLALAKYAEAANLSPNNVLFGQKISYIEQNVDFASFGYKLERADVEFFNLETLKVFSFLEQLVGKTVIYDGNYLKRTTLKLNNIPIDLIFSVVLILNNLEATINQSSIHVLDKK